MQDAVVKRLFATCFIDTHVILDSLFVSFLLLGFAVLVIRPLDCVIRLLLLLRYHSMASHHARFDALIDTVKEVSSFVLSHFLDPNFTKRVKVDGSIVTSIDCKAEEMAKELILSRFPDDSILGEEYGTVDGSTTYQWVIDPIDGTASFARGVPLFGTQIGLQYSGEPVAGAIDLPATGDFISAIVGEGAFHNDKRCIMSERSKLKQLMVSTTSYEYYQQTQSTELHKALVESGVSMRGYSDCFGFMLLCTGRIDAVVEPLLHPWDIIPWLPIIREAGGNFSRIAKGGFASNQKVHGLLYDVLNANITN